MTSREDIALRVADQAADCGVELVASLPDNWMAEIIRTFDRDDRFRHVPVNREESAVGLCSGAFLSGTGSLAVMGASGLMTLIYAITKINYTYEIPMTILATLRGAPGGLARGRDCRAGPLESEEALGWVSQRRRGSGRARRQLLFFWVLVS